MITNYDIRIAGRKRAIVELSDFKLQENSVNFLFGESGIGKSLSARALCGLIDTEQLDVWINGQDFSTYLQSAEYQSIREHGFFVFQEPSTHLNPLMRLADQLFEGSLNANYDDANILHALWDDTQDDQLRDLLAVYPKPHRPSGGEKQRILLAMAFKKINRYLASKQKQPTLFVFDEPTGNLDNHFRNMFLKLLFSRFQQFPFTTLFITHDYSMISEIYDHFPEMKTHVHFREMTRKANELHIRDFSPEEYLYWLKQQKPVENVASGKSETVLKIHAPIHIFGRKLFFTQQEKSRQQVRMAVHRGELVYLKAASGVGKTTLLKVLMGLLEAENLQIEIGDLPIRKSTDPKIWPERIWAKKAGMVFQHADEALNLQSGLSDVFSGLPLSNPAPSLNELLAPLFDTEDTLYPDQKIRNLSGGQKQRLNLLRTLALKPPLLLLDEPLNGLDLATIKKVLAQLRRIQREGTGILLVSHNEEIFDALVPETSVYYLHADMLNEVREEQ